MSLGELRAAGSLKGATLLSSQVWNEAPGPGDVIGAWGSEGARHRARDENASLRCKVANPSCSGSPGTWRLWRACRMRHSAGPALQGAGVGTRTVRLGLATVEESLTTLPMHLPS